MPHDLPRRLGLADSVAIVIGIIIGGGIFLVPNLVAQSVGSVPLILGVWAFAGLATFFGALACAELGAAWPATGGQYIYLRDAYGPLAGFLCGWSMFTVARSAQVAWLAVVFALYVGYFVPVGPIAAKLLGVAAIAVFTTINYRGVHAGAIVQKLFTTAKVGGLLLIVGSAFLLAPHAAPNAAARAPFSISSVGVALIACLLAYDGWVQLTFVAGEIRDPQRNVLRALALGTTAVIAIYLLANLAYLRVMTIAEIAASQHVGATAAERGRGREARLRHHHRVDSRDPQRLLPHDAAPLLRAGRRRPVLPPLRRDPPAVSNAGLRDRCAGAVVRRSSPHRVVRIADRVRALRDGALVRRDGRGRDGAAPDPPGRAAPVPHVGLPRHAAVVPRRHRLVPAEHADHEARAVAGEPRARRDRPAGVAHLEKTADRSSRRANSVVTP
jgi:hypothetical protein